MTYKDFTKMPVWSHSFDLVIKYYKLTKSFPDDERFGMAADVRRALNSVTHNIAEGFGRYEPRDKTRFYKISRGSAYELISQTLVSHALKYLNNKNKDEIVEELKQIIGELDALIISIENKSSPKP